VIISTRIKIAVARQLRNISVVVAHLSKATGHDGLVRVHRKGANWVLDLSEGIDLSIYLVGGFERSTHAAYRRLLKPGSICIDIGANIGSHTLPLADCVGDSGRVIAIEPTKIAYTKLCANIDANPDLTGRVSLLQAMVTSKDGDPPAESIYASWPVINREGESEEAHNLHLGVRQSTDGARTGTLQSLISEYDLSRVDLIKIDVDGYEMDVLNGAREILTSARPIIVMELSPYTWEERGVPSDAPVNFLRDLNYRFTDLAGKPFSSDGLSVPNISPGHSINIIAQYGQ